MSVISIGGVPGSGKTLFVTYLMKKKFKKENRFRFFKEKINNVFTNYPVKLSNYKIKKKKIKSIDKFTNEVSFESVLVDKNIYSRSCSLLDFSTWHKFIPDSVYVLDEFHTLFDSLDYKNFPKSISKVFQFHRHLGIKDIYVIAQHPSRIVKQVRILIDEFYKIKRFIKIPFLGIAFVKYSVYYNFDDYGKSTKVKKEDVAYDFENHFRFFRYKKVFKSYDTKYMSALVKDKDFYETVPYSALNLTQEDIYHNFGIKV